ncbi:MAG: putative enzyme related to lactoylglutathione lyase [Sphingobacteriales bacterium]|jgi:predicted enzyme related to lactoylglutathione lyase
MLKTASIIVFITFALNVNAQKQEKMESPILGLRTTIYKVGDLEKATAWVTKAFGIKPYFNEPFYVGFNINDYELGLQTMEPDKTHQAENVQTLWGVKDIKKEYQRFLDLGATAHEEPMNVGGELMTATLRDPWGNLIGLIFNPHFKANN